MKTLRIVGLIVILLIALGGAMGTARATAPIHCWSTCSGIPYYAECWLTLAQCCAKNSKCPRPYVFESGDCTDGMNYCP